MSINVHEHMFKLLVLFSLSVSVGLYFLFYSPSLNLDKLAQKIRLDALFDSINTSIPSESSPILNDSQRFDQLCDQIGEWESLGRHAFFKRSAAYYFVDAGLLNMHYLKLAGHVQNFTLSVQLIKDDEIIDTFNVSNTTIREVWSAGEYLFASLRSQFSSIHLTNQQNTTGYQMKVIVFDTSNQTQTRSYINIKIKFLKTDSNQKNSTMVCAKCFHGSHKDYYLTMKWWLELNQRAGFEKVSMCDHQIEDHPDILALYKQHAGFLDLRKLRCIPNLLPPDKFGSYKYFKNYNMASGSFEPDVPKIETINSLVLNECYLDNIDKYRYIASYDNDEVIITHQANSYLTVTDFVDYINGMNKTYEEMMTHSIDIEQFIDQFKCERHTSNKLMLEEYLSELENVSKSKKELPSSYYFPQGFLLDSIFMNHLFEKLDQVLKALDLKSIFSNQTSPVSIYFNVSDLRRPVFSPATFPITIKSHRELMYAINMLDIYKKYFKTYITQNARLFADKTKDHDRFYALVGHINHAMGKTLHNTQLTFDLSIHYPEDYIDPSADPPSIKSGQTAWNLNEFPHDLAHLSHFRKVQNFNFPEVPFEFFIIDLNYFNCYFKPILSKFVQEPINFKKSFD